jgi:hypothetical protein
MPETYSSYRDPLNASQRPHCSQNVTQRYIWRKRNDALKKRVFFVELLIIRE